MIAAPERSWTDHDSLISRVASSNLTIGPTSADKKTHLCGGRRATSCFRGSFSTTSPHSLLAMAAFPGAAVVPRRAGSQSAVCRAYCAVSSTAAGRRPAPSRADLDRSQDRPPRRRAALREWGLRCRGDRGLLCITAASARRRTCRSSELAIRRSSAHHGGAADPQHLQGVRCAFADGTDRRFPGQGEVADPELLQPALAPVLDPSWHLSRQIHFDNCWPSWRAHYPEVQRLQQIDGVGPVISILVRARGRRSKAVLQQSTDWLWQGLCPRSHSSGDSSPQLRIQQGRRWLGYAACWTQGAQRILGPFGLTVTCAASVADRRAWRQVREEARNDRRRLQAVLMHHLGAQAVTTNRSISPTGESGSPRPRWPDRRLST